MHLEQIFNSRYWTPFRVLPLYLARSLHVLFVIKFLGPICRAANELSCSLTTHAQLGQGSSELALAMKQTELGYV